MQRLKLQQIIMGSIISTLSLVYETLNSLYTSYSRLITRLALSPGIPVPNPTLSSWTVPPSRIGKENSGARPSNGKADDEEVRSHGECEPPKLPFYADVVIIGSGITGTSVARTLLMSGKPMRIVMLDARDACDGATGRYVCIIVASLGK